MVFKLIGKLLLKATVPLLIVAGLFTYGLYSRGGDPMAMWKGFGSGVMDQMASLFSNVKDDASNAADMVADVVNVSPGGSDSAQTGGSKRTQVFTWKDANGVTHYSTIAPTDADSTKISVNPNTNVMAPIKISKPVKVSRSEERVEGDKGQNALSPSASRSERNKNKDERQEYSDPAVKEVADQLGGELPGVVGQILSSQGDSPGGLNPAQLLKMLQQ